jgi:hypothetical protein
LAIIASKAAGSAVFPGNTSHDAGGSEKDTEKGRGGVGENRLKFLASTVFSLLFF